MYTRIKYYWQYRPLESIIFIAAIIRLLAAIFSKGYAMSDDHFVVVHTAQRWVDGYNNWFDTDQPSHHSLVYPGLHYIFFYLLKTIGITDPQFKMLLVRLIHAGYSMLIVYYGYLITLKLSNERNAKQVGIILSLFWVLPFMSVRNLIEVVCIPPMLIGYYLSLIGNEKGKNKYWLYTGLTFGIAFVFRYQTLLLTGSIALVLLFKQQWKKLYCYAIGVILTIFFIQGMVDWIAWGYPLASFFQYIGFNIEHRFDYTIGPWYKYVLIIIGVFIPPISFLLIYGVGRMWRKIEIMFWPVLIFLIFHSYFPNKQERFMLPILPFIIILGIIGLNDILTTSKFWKYHKKLIKGSWIWFWIINSIFLVLFTFTYSKRSLVESFTYLSEKDDLNGLIIEYNRDNMPWFPRYYLTKKVPIYRFSINKSGEQFKETIISAKAEFPNYILFFGNEDIENRIKRIERLFVVQLEFDQRINPSLIDSILYALNPKHNRNLTSLIYKIVDFQRLE